MSYLNHPDNSLTRVPSVQSLSAEPRGLMLEGLLKAGEDTSPAAEGCGLRFHAPRSSSRLLKK